MKKSILIIVAVIVKTLATITIGLVFTNDIASYVSMVSRTHSITFRFLLYIFFVDAITLVIFTQIAKSFFSVSKTIKIYLLFSVMALLVFWLSDAFFLVEVKSEQIVHHVFTLIVLLCKYVLFLFLGTSYILQLHKIEAEKKLKLFLNYQLFKFKSIINKKFFSLSKVLYRNDILFAISMVLILFVNFLSLFLYTNSIFFFFNIVICSVVLFYLMLISFHQLSTILGVYENHLKKSNETGLEHLQDPK